jgi:hypothetical protein
MSSKLLRVAAGLAVVVLAAAAACGGDGDDGPSAGTTPGADGGGTAQATQPAGREGPPSEANAAVAGGAASGPVGSEVTATIEALGVTEPGLGAWTVEVTYDPDIVSAVSCEASPPPSACNAHKDERTVRFAGAAAMGVAGDVTLATITFRCEAAGTSPLAVTLEILADATIGDPRPIDGSIEDGQVTCE